MQLTFAPTTTMQCSGSMSGNRLSVLQKKRLQPPEDMTQCGSKHVHRPGFIETQDMRRVAGGSGQMLTCIHW
jgi:hypothetical protein